jgi:hypothetical protein
MKFVPLLLVVALAGCAGQVVPCPGIAEHIDVSVEPSDGGRALPDGIRGLLKVRAGCLDARYDPVTEQGRWSYWVELKNIQERNRTATYEFHLTQLVRKVTNHLDRSHTRGEVTAVTLEEYRLDVLRAASFAIFSASSCLPSPWSLAARAAFSLAS